MVENVDGEDKLGQPMLRYQRFTDIGTIEAYVLPYFRERTFEGRDGRLSGGIVVANDEAIYESASAQSNIDYALRYSHSLGPVDFGLSWFSGTSREPDIFSNINPLTLSSRPIYPQIEQLSTDIQAIVGGWLFKLEAIQRRFESPFYEDFLAATIGAEYTLVGVLNSSFDLGLLSEYSWDQRDELSVSPFQDDLFVGARLALNDVASSELLVGFSNDLTYSGSHALFIEGSTRLNDKVSFSIEARFFDAETQQDPCMRFETVALSS